MKRTEIFRYNIITFLMICAAFSPAVAQNESGEAEPEVELEEVVVTAAAHDEIRIDSLDQVQQRVNRVPGGASVIDLNTEILGQIVTTADVFRFEPGVYAQSGSVPNDARISVRGSGLTRRFGNRGLTLLIDGIPANNVDGSFYTRAYDRQNIEYVSVYRGANGLPYGGTQLGGAIDFVQKNGRTAPGFSATGEYGTYESARANVSYGFHEGAVDGFGSVSWAESDGYRDHQSWRDFHGNANLGIQWAEQAITRFYFLYNESKADLASGLSKQLALNDPRRSRNSSVEDRDLATLRVSQKTVFQVEDTEFLFYSYYQNLDFDHTTSVNPTNLIDFDTDEFGFGVRTETKYDMFGLEHNLRVNSGFNWGQNEVGGTSRRFVGFPTFGFVTSANDYTDTSYNFQFYFENETQLLENLALIYGTGWQYSNRQRDVHSGNLNPNVTSSKEDYDGFTPRVGLIYTAIDGWDLFTNYSLSVEAPALSEAANSLEEQEAQTVEVGSRWQRNRINAEAVYYYSWVQDDFVDFDTNGAGTFAARNFATTRQGVELSLTVPLTPEDLPVGVWLDNVYQWNEALFEQDGLGGRRLPGIAEHSWSGRLRFQDPDGIWKVAFSGEALSDIEVNNANTIDTADSFALFHIALEWNINQHLKWYGGINNVLDTRYINSVTVNPFGNNTASTYSPGNGRHFFTGMTVKW